jgi:hypothetical protein
MKNVREHGSEGVSYPQADYQRPNVSHHHRHGDSQRCARDIRYEFVPEDPCKTNLFAKEHQADVL